MMEYRRGSPEYRMHLVFGFGVSHWEHGHLDALSEYEQALEICPVMLGFLQSAGRAHRGLGEYNPREPLPQELGDRMLKLVDSQAERAADVWRVASRNADAMRGAFFAAVFAWARVAGLSLGECEPPCDLAALKRLACEVWSAADGNECVDLSRLAARKYVAQSYGVAAGSAMSGFEYDLGADLMIDCAAKVMRDSGFGVPQRGADGRTFMGRKLPPAITSRLDAIGFSGYDKPAVSLFPKRRPGESKLDASHGAASAAARAVRDVVLSAFDAVVDERRRDRASAVQAGDFSPE